MFKVYYQKQMYINGGKQMKNNFCECNDMSYIEKHNYLESLHRVITVEQKRLSDYLEAVDEELKELEGITQ